MLDDLTIVGNGHATILFALGKNEWRWVASADGVRFTQEYIAQQWPQRTDRMDRLLSARHAGFLGDLDVYTAEEMDREPVFTEFHRPRGLGWGTATTIPVPTAWAIARTRPSTPGGDGGTSAPGRGRSSGQVKARSAAAGL